MKLFEKIRKATHGQEQEFAAQYAQHRKTESIDNLRRAARIFGGWEPREAIENGEAPSEGKARSEEGPEGPESKGSQ